MIPHSPQGAITLCGESSGWVAFSLRHPTLSVGVTIPNVRTDGRGGRGVYPSPPLSCGHKYAGVVNVLKTIREWLRFRNVSPCFVHGLFKDFY